MTAQPDLATDLATDFGPGAARPPAAKDEAARGGATHRAALTVGGGPDNGYTTVPGLGASSPHALRVDAPAGVRAEAVVLEGPWLLTDRTRLTYRLFPDLVDGDATCSSTYVSLDAELEDGTRLSALGARDNHGFPLTARAQGEAEWMYARQWNHVECEVGALASGRVVERLLVVVDAPAASPDVRAWVSDVRLEGTPAPRPSEPVDLVDTRRGTNAGATFSRGNTIPAAAVPNGFTLAAPMTAWSRDWFYSWSGHDTPAGRPEHHGVVLSHQPSPWMGDRDQLVLTAAREGAGPVTFSHDAEVARPHRYEVVLDDATRLALAPSDHGAVVRWEATEDTAYLEVTLTTVEGECELALDGEGRLRGWVEGGSGLSVGASRMYVYGEVDAQATGAVVTREAGDGAPRPDRLVLRVPGARAQVRVATSFVSLSQAEHTFGLELAGRTLEDVAGAARARWTERLGVLALEGASHEERVSAYGCLYRVNLYPSAHHENAGTAAHPRYVHASPVMEHVGETTADRTGAVVRDGRAYVNHGFWDTYRTVWPLYALVYPELAAELADGFVEQYRSAGWISRWASPGYADLMTGTSSDVAFADLYVKGVPLPDLEATYASALRNATALPPSNAVGRRDLRTGAYLGFPTADVPEAVSWAVEAALNDAGIAAMARGMAAAAEDSAHDGAAADGAGARADRLRTEARYLARRSLAYRQAFDPGTGFFRSRWAEGSYRVPDGEFDPLDWGGDYTETNAWTYDFPAPHDGAGLAALHGGPDALGARLDQYFATPERADHEGAYGYVIHEMTEARDIRRGQFGISNQPAHHVPFVYAFAQRPGDASRVVRDVVRRLFTGSEIGQGYPGDEDNGEMSAWYLWALMGLYPLQVGTPRYVLTAPALPRLTWHLPAGDLVIEASVEGAADGADDGAARLAEAVHIAALTLDGAAHTSSWVDHAALRGGAHLVAALSAAPTAWATGAQDVPPSVGEDVGEPDLRPWTDVTRGARVLLDGAGAASAEAAGVQALVGDDPTAVSLPAGASLTVELSEPGRAAWNAVGGPEVYTLTCGAEPGGAPSSWRCEVRTADGTWHTVDERAGEAFDWPWQLRPFAVTIPEVAREHVEAFRLAPLTPGTLTQLEVLA